MKRTAIAILALAPIVWGCDQDPPVESADLRRPAGLVEVPRAQDGDIFRTDVLVVDTEAQGVRVVQYGRTSTLAPAAAFVPAPVVYFPLVVSAPGYPTRVAMNEGGSHAFVIATADVGRDLDAVRVARSFLHVLDIPVLTFGGRVGTDDHILLNSLDITEPVPGEVFVPVDVVSLGSVGGNDRIAIAYDQLGSASGRVGIYDFPAEVARAPAELTLASAPMIYEVPGGVTELTVHGGRLYTTSSFMAATSSVANVVTEIDPDSGVTGALDAGGPTVHLVSAGPYGLLALRADIPSVVVFEGDPPVRSTSMFPSPYTPPIERALDPDLPGRIDLHDSPLGPGAFAPRVPQLRFSTVAETSANAPVVLVTHADGTGSFLYAPLNDDGSTGAFNLGELSPSNITTVWSTGGDVGIVECPGEGVLGEDTPEEDPACADDVVQVPLPNNRRLRARLNGALARSRDGLVDTTVTSTSAVWRLSDSGFDFEARQVRVGDVVRISALFPTGCEEAPNEELVPVDFVESIFDTRVVVVGRTTLELSVVSGPTPLDCADTFEPFFWEAYPGADEGVLTQLAGGDIDAVLERVPLVNDRIVFGTTLDADGLPPPVAFTLAVSTDCNGNRMDGDVCSSALECAVGWSCVAPTTNDEDGETTTSGGLSRCQVSVCTQDVCMERPFNRGCPGVELLLLGAESADVDLRRDTAVGGTSVPSTAPDDAISFDEGRYFMVSYPGARSIVEVRPGGTLVVDQRR